MQKKSVDWVKTKRSCCYAGDISNKTVDSTCTAKALVCIMSKNFIRRRQRRFRNSTSRIVKRHNFLNCYFRGVYTSEIYLTLVLFSDEAIFHLSRYVRSRNNSLKTSAVHFHIFQWYCRGLLVLFGGWLSIHKWLFSQRDYLYGNVRQLLS
jgi:hypothetical protein